MKLGMVTYMWGARWDLPTLIANCAATGFEGVELRTTHAHGVEVSLSGAQRMDVRRRFADSPVECVGLGSACEYHSTDPAVVAQNVEQTKQFLVLSHDIGASGVKVRPNGLNPGEEPERTVERIGKALWECGRFAEGYGQEIRVEVHGKGTQAPEVMAAIMRAADHESVRICWNSNAGEVRNGSVRESFDALKPFLGRTVHIHDLYDPQYPYRELFALLRESEFDGCTLSESPATDDPLRVMRYYKALWDELSRAA